MASWNTLRPNPNISGPISGISNQNENTPLSTQNPQVVERASLRENNKKTFVEGGSASAFILYWEPYYTNGLINVPYREIYNRLLREYGNSPTPEVFYRYRGIDLFLLKEADFNNFENNEIAVFLPISVGRYLVLEDFEMPKSIISAQKVSQGGKYVTVFTDNFPRFSMDLKVVIFGNIHIRVKQFFDIVLKLISKNAPGRLIMYDIFGNIKLSDADIFTTLQYNKTPFYRLLPTNVSFSRHSSDNNFLSIDVNGIVLEIGNERYI